MGRESVVLAVVLGALVTACSEGGTALPVEAGESDATETHDVVFVSQVDNDGPDDPMEWDGASDEGGDDEGVDAAGEVGGPDGGVDGGG
jgi:hypothetical protein